MIDEVPLPRRRGRPPKPKVKRLPRHPPLPFQETRDRLARELREAKNPVQPAYSPTKTVVDLATTGLATVEQAIVGPSGRVYRFDLSRAELAAAAEALAKRSKHGIQGLAANSRRTRASDWLTWLAFCAHNDRVVLPASFNDLAQFVLELICAGRKKATIEHILWSIANVHTRHRLPDPMANPDWIDFWRDRLRNDLHGEQAQAAPLRLELLQRLVKALSQSSVTHRRVQPRLRDCVVAAQQRRRLRDIAMLNVAYDLLTRASELVSLEWGRLTKERDGSGTYRFSKTKTDQVGKGKVLYLRPETMAALGDWQAASPYGGYIFHPVSDDVELPLKKAIDERERRAWEERQKRGQSLELKKLTQREVGTVFRRACLAAGIELKETWLSGHSARVGAAQDMAAAGLSTAEMQIAGRWASERMPVHYAAQVKASQSGKRRFRKVEAMQLDGDQDE